MAPLKRMSRVSKYIKTYPGKTATQIAGKLNLEIEQVHSCCWNLMNKGIIERIAQNGPRGGWTYRGVK